MSQDPRHVPHTLHAAITLATSVLDLPLNARQCEALALELSGPVRALLAEALDGQAADVPVRYAVVAPDEPAEAETTTYDGCTSRIGADVDHDSPAAALAADLRHHHDVTATDVPTPDYLGLTVRPRTARAWAWWCEKFGIAAEVVALQGEDAYAVGEQNGVAVHLRGNGIGPLLSPDIRTRPGLDVHLDSPAGTVATKARRQPDVTGIDIHDAHTLTITVAVTSLMEWQWWLKELAAQTSPVAFDGTTAFVTARKDGATVHLRGEGGRLQDLLAESRPVTS